MITYLDTSALVKLYVEETGSSAVASIVEAATAVATVRVAYVEARAAFGRHRREGRLTPYVHRRLIRHFDTDWDCYTLVEVSDLLVRRAGTLADQHGLRGYDALHLAAALELTSDTSPAAFVCFDDRLASAARRQGLRAFP